MHALGDLGTIGSTYLTYASLLSNNERESFGEYQHAVHLWNERRVKNQSTYLERQCSLRFSSSSTKVYNKYSEQRNEDPSGYLHLQIKIPAALLVR